MKKALFVFFAIIAMSISMSAQDIIVKKDSQRVDAKILEVSDTEIKYKQWAYQDGPTFVIKVHEISSIIYASGQVVAYNNALEEARQTYSQSAARTRNAAPAPRRQGSITFNPEPLTANRPFGVSVGYVSKQMSYDGEKAAWVNVSDKEKSTSSAFQVGFSYSPEFRYGIGLQTGLYYELSASSYSEEGVKVSADEHTLSIPLRVQYRYEIIPDFSVFLYTGPSFDISVAYNMTASYDGEKESMNMYEDSEINRFNMLWGVGAGFRWKGLQLRLGGDWGLTSLSKDYDIFLSKPFNISISYLF